jgi:hypothetical protein
MCERLMGVERVEQDKHILHPEGVIPPPYVDARRVVALNQVVLGETVPIHPPVPIQKAPAPKA